MALSIVVMQPAFAVVSDAVISSKLASAKVLPKGATYKLVRNEGDLRIEISHYPTLVLTEDAKNWLADAGYEPLYGARPLKRLIQRDIENPLSLLILKGEFIEGDIIMVGVGEGDEKLTFKKEGTLVTV